MRILFLSHYFYPEGNAPGTRVYELTRRWAPRLAPCLWVHHAALICRRGATREGIDHVHP